MSPVANVCWKLPPLVSGNRRSKVSGIAFLIALLATYWKFLFAYRYRVATISRKFAGVYRHNHSRRFSPEFKAMWRDNDVHTHGEGVKHIKHPVLGPIAFEYSAFAVDGRPDLSMVVYNPTTSADADKISSLIGSAPTLERPAGQLVST
jgi:hypothetical protein